MDKNIELAGNKYKSKYDFWSYAIDTSDGKLDISREQKYIHEILEGDVVSVNCTSSSTILNNEKHGKVLNRSIIGFKHNNSQCVLYLHEFLECFEIIKEQDMDNYKEQMKAWEELDTSFSELCLYLNNKYSIEFNRFLRNIDKFINSQKPLEVVEGSIYKSKKVIYTDLGSGNVGVISDEEIFILDEIRDKYVWLSNIDEKGYYCHSVSLDQFNQHNFELVSR